jgi:hypothetical protein
MLLVGLEKYGPAPLRDVLPSYLFLASTLAMPVILYLGYAAFFRRAAASIGGAKDLEARYSRAIGGVKADVSLGRLLNVHGTPTFYVNGVRAEDGNQPITGAGPGGTLY